MFDKQDMQALAFIAGRYESARVLLDHLEIVSETEELSFQRGNYVEWQLSQPAAWAYVDALHEEDGEPYVPPLAGGHLAQELLSFYNQIV